MRQAGQPAPEIIIPLDGLHVWEWFMELDAGRGGNGFGPNPISFSEIDSWCRLVGARPDAWEVRAIRAMDRAFLATMAKRKD